MQLKTLKLIYAIAEDCFGQEDYEVGKFWCKAAKNGLGRTVGDAHVSFHMCNNLLAKIYEAQDSRPMAASLRKELPNDFHGIAF